MKNKIQIQNNIILKKFDKKIKRKYRKKNNKKKYTYFNSLARIELGNNFELQNQINTWLPDTLKFIIYHSKTSFKSSFNNDSYRPINFNLNVPKIFSLIDNHKESYNFIHNTVFNVLSDNYRKVIINYQNCTKIGLAAQVYFDVILEDLNKFLRLRDRSKKTQTRMVSISGVNINNEDVRKLLFSVGLPSNLSKGIPKYPDIIPYKLCIHNKEFNKLENARCKEIHSTELVSYVINSLAAIGKSLTLEKIEDLSTVIGEILINAEEHSTRKYRYSIGYFQKYKNGSDSYGIFYLVIMNFGETIYEKFKSPNCTNDNIKDRMRDLSRKYTKQKWFGNSFEEETLWTMYALQEGITSVSVDQFKRGNGSIRFIESFFNIKEDNGSDNISRMAVISGNTNIIFDGSYGIKNITKGNEDFKVMTFNKTNNIEDKPDQKFVKSVPNYFPGTIISAKILINQDDVT